MRIFFLVCLSCLVTLQSALAGGDSPSAERLLMSPSPVESLGEVNNDFLRPLQRQGRVCCNTFDKLMVLAGGVGALAATVGFIMLAFAPNYKKGCCKEANPSCCPEVGNSSCSAPVDRCHTCPANQYLYCGPRGNTFKETKSSLALEVIGEFSVVGGLITIFASVVATCLSN